MGTSSPRRNRPAPAALPRGGGALRPPGLYARTSGATPWVPGRDGQKPPGEGAGTIAWSIAAPRSGSSGRDVVRVAAFVGSGLDAAGIDDPRTYGSGDAPHCCWQHVGGQSNTGAGGCTYERGPEGHDYD